MGNNKLFTKLLVVTALVWVTACSSYGNWIKGNGQIVTEDRTIQAAKTVDLSIPADIHLVQGAPSMSVTADANLLPFIEQKTSGDTLSIFVDSGYYLKSTDRIRIELSLPQIEHIDVVGSTTVKMDEMSLPRLMLEGSGATKFDIAALSLDDALLVDLTGSGMVEIAALTAETVEADISGSGQIKILGGKANSLSLDTSGSSLLDAVDFPVKEADISLSGSGIVTVYVLERLHVMSSGSGRVNYRGRAGLTLAMSGSSSIKQIPE